MHRVSDPAAHDERREACGRGHRGQSDRGADARQRDAGRAEPGESQSAVRPVRRGRLEEAERAGDERGRPPGAQRAGGIAGQLAAESAREIVEHAGRGPDEGRRDGNQQRERERRSQLLADERGGDHACTARPSRRS